MDRSEGPTRSRRISFVIDAVLRLKSVERFKACIPQIPSSQINPALSPFLQNH
jgi:hypothetical protein